jgi:RNA polymerase sigma-70 factor (ECF subfamily)
MPETPVSLLERLARPQPEQSDWDRLVKLYRPWLRAWLRGRPLQAADVDDLIQKVLRVLVEKLADFRHAGHAGAFRGWLRSILVRELRSHYRQHQGRPLTLGETGEEMLAQLEQADSALSRRWDQDHDRHVLGRLLELLEPEFTTSTWEAFRRSSLEDRNVATVAAELGITSNAVCIAKSRVLRRLREEARGLLDG